MPESSTENPQGMSKAENEAAIEALLSGESVEKPDPTADEVEDPAPDDQADDAADGEKPAEKPAIDYSMEIEIPLGGNQGKITLGELKDFYQNQAQREIEATATESKTLAHLDEIREIATMLQALPPEMVQRATEQRQQSIEVERKALVNAIPAFATEQGFAAGREQILKLATEYGLQNDIGSITNHKAIKLIHDFAVLKAKVQAAGTLAEKKVELPKAQLRAVEAKKSDTESLIAKAKASGNQALREQAISKLIGG
jgi:hypothetical protein